ncbi:MAG: flavin-dependent dehydrogenase [Planctomycetota bacterium]|jgi:flavin-dependent dehydrogenase
MSSHDYDVAIIGGGPAGSTVGSFLRKYNPELRVLILEREKFPRDHVGESQLPPVGIILDEIGCWEKVEAANFPIKIGATYRWGKSAELWDFDFLPDKDFKEEARPAKFEGQRQQTAFQVDRAVYDDILLRHAEEFGCKVKEETGVAKVHSEGERVTGLELKDGSMVTAKYYVDCSGHTGVLRRALGVETTVPTSLKNIALYDYWENAEWATEIGIGGTRVQVMSKGTGWLWFIPLSATRTSIGFVCPADYYKSLDEDAEELYHSMIQSDERIAPLVKNAKCRGKLERVNDWSFMSSKNAGENWFLAGEAAGFADPVLAAGLTLTHTSARELAYVILELFRSEDDADWLKSNYDETQRQRIHQHIRFADFWYANNGQFDDLQEQCAQIANDAGLKMTPGAAWTWLAQGGFTHDTLGQAGIGSIDLAALKQITQLFSQKQAHWHLNNYNVFKLNLQSARKDFVPKFAGGKIEKIACYMKGERRLPMTGMYKVLVEQLELASDIGTVYKRLQQGLAEKLEPKHAQVALMHAVQTLEVMVSEGWVTAKLNKKKAKLNLNTPDEGGMIHLNRDKPKT